MQVDMERGMTRAIDRAFDTLEDVMRHPERYPDDAVILPLRALATGKHGVFSKGRLRLLLEIRERGALAGVDALAARLHREKTRVSKDVAFLEQMGLVKSRKVGRTKQVVATGRKIILQ